MGEHLSALDATFLELEEADQSAHMHIGGVIVLEPQPYGGAPPIDLVRMSVLTRLPELPRYRQKLSAPRTGGLHWPTWEDDPDFRVERHVRVAGLPRPGGVEQLIEWAGEYYSQRLDRTKPLWEITVLELADGRWALVTKTHHCMIDGVGSVDMATTLLDTDPEPHLGGATEGGNGAETPASTSTATPRSSSAAAATWRRAIALVTRPAGAAASVASRAAQAGRHATESAVDVATHPEHARDALHRSRALAELLLRDELIAAPSCSLNRPIGTGRRLAVLKVGLDELKRIKNSLGGTLNDVVLAAAAGGLRTLLIHRGEETPEAGLRAMVPVNVRAAGDHMAMGNKISSLFVHLPVAEEDPRRRYRQQIDEAEGLKSGTQAIGSSTLIDLTRHLPPVIHSFMARSMYATRLFNLTITNVPGPQTPLYYLGSRVREIWPLVPIAAEHAIGLAVFSYDGTLFFCINSDEDSAQDLDVLRDGIADSIAELRELAAAQAA
jgi:diacylglycerol O-acyltransferase / wax synthase